MVSGRNALVLTLGQEIDAQTMQAWSRESSLKDRKVL